MNSVQLINILDEQQHNGNGSDLAPINHVTKSHVNQFQCHIQQNAVNLKIENFENKSENEINFLKTQLNSLKLKNEELERKLDKSTKELDQFKRINTIQENCIENSESEILRLNECLRTTETLLQNTVEVSEKIISDLKSKLKSANDLQIKNSTTTKISTVETKVHKPKQKKSKPYFYVNLNQNSLTNKFNANLKNKLELKILENQINSDLSQFVLKIIRQMSQNVNKIEELSEILTKKLNKTFGKYWNCVIGENLCEYSIINYSNDNYLKCELNEMIQFIIFKNNKQYFPNNSVQDNTLPINSEVNPTVRFLRKSNNIEGPVEKFIINAALDGLNKNNNNYKSLGQFLRDSICNKYNSQWFVSVGQTNQYSTSWAMSRSRKFMLFEIGDIKFTCGEVAGWIW